MRQGWIPDRFERKAANAEGRRRRKEQLGQGAPEAPADTGGMAPLLRKLIAEYAATGIPPAYLPKDGFWAVMEQKTGLRSDAEYLAAMLPEISVGPDVAIQGSACNSQFIT